MNRDHVDAAGRPRLIIALKAVLDLHRQVECCDEDGKPIGHYYCEECKDLDDHSGERVHEVYPCPTVQQITAAINGQWTIAEMRTRFEASAALKAQS